MDKDYYDTHREQWNQYRQNQRNKFATKEEWRAYRREIEARYRAANPEKVREKDSRVKANRRSAPSGQLDYILRNRRGWAKKHGIFFDDALLALAKNPPTHCPCCKEPITYGTGQGYSRRGPSVDRVCSSGEYTCGNVRIICMICNQIKNEGTVDDHRLVIAYMTKHALRLVNGEQSRVEQTILLVKDQIRKLTMTRGRACARLRPWVKFDFILRNARSRARAIGMMFDDDLLLLAQVYLPDCGCCGITVLYDAEGQNPCSASIDRVVCAAGYTTANADIVCMRCNGIKNEGTIADHEMVVAYMLDPANRQEQQ